MIQRIAAAAILLPLLLFAIFYLPLILFLLLINLLLGIAVFELLQLLSHCGLQTYWPTFLLVLSLPWIWCYHSDQVVIHLIFSGLLCMSWSILRNRDARLGFPSASGNFMTLFYLGIPLSLAADLQHRNPLELVLVLFILWAGDSGAYFVGRKWGKHKVVPLLSPRKSLEGYVSGLLCSLLTAVLVGAYFFPTWSMAYLGFTGILLGVLGGLGDLFESALKRGAHVKDSSRLIPGHGGLLDRIDSLLFALPSYYLLTVLVK